MASDPLIYRHRDGDVFWLTIEDSDRKVLWESDWYSVDIFNLEEWDILLKDLEKEIVSLGLEGTVLVSNEYDIRGDVPMWEYKDGGLVPKK